MSKVGKVSRKGISSGGVAEVFMEELTSNSFYSALFIALGMSCLFLEVFIPSGGLLGVLFLACSAFGVYGFFQQGHTGTAFTAIVGIGVLSFYALRFGLQRTALHTSLDSKGYTSVDEQIGSLMGKEGTTVTELRPAGMALIEGKKIDVVSSGRFVAEGVTVRVVDNTGNRVVVRPTRIGNQESIRPKEDDGTVGSING